MDTLKIPRGNKRNARTFLVLGLLMSIISVALLYIPYVTISLLASFGIIAAYIGIRIGISKLNQPDYGIVICHDHIQFHHQYGGWSLHWSDIQRIGIPTVGRGFERRELGYVGIRVQNYHHLLKTLSPRLCAHLLTEQRAALFIALRQDCLTGTCPSDHLLEDDYFCDKDGQIYQGLLAMFANRMQKLRTLTGFDLLMDQDILEDEPVHFISLVKQYKTSSNR
ncbi:MAG: hypothetical protein CENE_03033 [Candidatus Celerinatantimonas neptuna]|nr:MAG: hypothetical protein CENE_03033 [Candidatus Celerinatantimonas neptuna]